jgi:hypothetical protein
LIRSSDGHFWVENGDVGDDDSILNSENEKTPHFVFVVFFFLLPLKRVLDISALEIKGEEIYRGKEMEKEKRGLC